MSKHTGRDSTTRRDFSIFRVIWSTYLLKFAIIACSINFQKLRNRVALSNRVRCAWTLNIKAKGRTMVMYIFCRYNFKKQIKQ
jgi:hypothetical protein